MNLFVTHLTALEFWRAQGRPRNNSRHSDGIFTPPASSPVIDNALRAAKLHQLSLPIDVTVCRPGARLDSPIVKTHVFGSPLPSECFVYLGNDVYVSSPEYCFFQMADVLTMTELILLGLELCGSYSLFNSQLNSFDAGRDYSSSFERPGSQSSVSNSTNMQSDLTVDGNSAQAAASRTVGSEAGQGFRNRMPLTSVSKLSAFVNKMVGIRGQRKAEKSLQYIANLSASPMESILVVLLTLPYRLGGYHLPLPELNALVVPQRIAKQNASKSSYFCDLLWRKAGVAAEYDSDQFHTGSDRIANDSKRRNSLITVGVNTVTVTKQQLYSIVEFDKIARQLASMLHHRLRTERQGDFRDARRALRRTLRLSR
jgi:hypothetical protein